jgi:hypothetical protein
MRRNLNLTTFLLGAFVLSGVFATAARAQIGVLADGNPPLTNQMVARYSGLLEWSLGVPFSDEDRRAIEKQMVAYWQTGDDKNVKAVLGTLDFEKNLSNAGEAKKQELQPQVRQAILETLEKEPDDSMNRVLLRIYKKSQLAVAENTGGGGENSGGDLSRLVGKWQVLHGNSIVGVDRVSGRIGDGNSMIAQYDIKSDGRVIFTFVLQQSNFGCTTRIKTSKTGRASVAGSRVTFAYDGGTTVSEDGCNAKYNYTKKLSAEKETFDFNLKRGDNGKPNFCFANSKLKDCAVKVE